MYNRAADLIIGGDFLTFQNIAKTSETPRNDQKPEEKTKNSVYKGNCEILPGLSGKSRIFPRTRAHDIVFDFFPDFSQVLHNV